MFKWLIILTFFSNDLFASKAIGQFTGRVSRINLAAELIRIKIGFSNIKYLNKKDKVEFGDERTQKIRCKGYVVGRTSDYLLLKVPELDECMQSVFLSPGAYLLFHSEDMRNNISIGKDLVRILLTKKLVMDGQMQRKKKNLQKNLEKMNAVNERYHLLRSKLEAEWRDNLEAIEKDRITELGNYQDLEKRLDDLKFKLEKYKVEDENLRLDRWALDSNLHYRK